ncbi:hypothetical protein chiPu_0029434 [Chiloscyllium punctatum]|uniref:Uncharacterized protein n=1 Tax=Chiloscyllium punctatum TaxID=137246 RepID=A0A401TRD1_CHIPU|nr:hypothetical protein [Chiloscyllium punctatum]
MFVSEQDVLPSEMLRDDAVASVDTVVPDRVDADQEADPGNHMKTPGAEAVGELSLGVEGDRESQNSPEVLQAHEEGTECVSLFSLGCGVGYPSGQSSPSTVNHQPYSIAPRKGGGEIDPFTLPSATKADLISL